MRVEHERKTYGLFPQVIFFLLTCGALAAFHQLIDENGIITGVAALALAEYLIHRYRWYRTGVEAALWIGGLFALISELPNSGKPEAMLVLASAAAIAGARLRHPVFGALAAGLLMHYFEKKWDLGVLAALLIAAVAIALLCRTWQRRSNEWLFILIAVTLPLAGWAEADAKWRTVTIALYAAFGVLALAVAIVKPHHAFFLAAAEGFAVAAIGLAEELDARPEIALAIGGALLLSLSLVVSRALRGRTRGFVATKEQLPAADAIEIAGAIAISPSERPAAPENGGGQFGGAGASGTF
ncbi:MAG TPA: hypothetical protein VKB93_09940 [Thermoanaerobaculia bacterium]|nr:hypothetical protein [Thermoanaerobaculia bacterium]